MSLKTKASSALPLGDVQFFNRHIPTMHGGDYTIAVQQSVESNSVVQGGKPLPKTQFPGPQPLAQTVSVAAPRYALDPADVHAVFPPSGQVGAFDQNLASVTLCGGALPWERELAPQDADTPYLAVLLVREDELVRGATTYHATQILNPPAGTMGPQITREDRQDKMGEVSAITVEAGGRGYSHATVDLAGGIGAGGTAAQAQAVIASGVAVSAAVTDAGAGYLAAPTVTISGTGTGFAATAVVENGAVQRLVITQAGAGYDASATLTLGGGGGTGAKATVEIADGVIVGVTMTETGSGYSSTPSVTVSGDGSGAVAHAARGVQGRAIDMTTAMFTALMPRYDGGAEVEPRWLAHVRDVPVEDKETGVATGTTEFGVVVGNRFPAAGPGPLAELVLETSGQGYAQAPDVTITGGGGGAGAQAVATLSGDRVTDITITDGGAGYSSPPTVTLSGGGGTGATAIARTRGRWQAHLVSLEGWGDYLGAAPAWPTDPATSKPVENVRVVSLFSWSFYCLSEAGNFRDLVETLAAPAGKGGATKSDLLLRMPDPGPGDGSPSALGVQSAFGAGYTALQYQTRAGVDTFAWYRGPLTPEPVPPLAQQAPWDNAGAAMIYDETTGLFDQSYAAGWQAGRLLGLSDPNFATQLRTWRRQGITLTNLLFARLKATPNSLLQKYLPSADLGKDDAGTVAALEAMLEADLLSDAVIDYLTGHFLDNVAPTLGLADAQETARGYGAPTQAALKAPAPPPAAVITDLRAFLETPAVAALLAKMNGTDLGDPAPSALSYVVEWLGDLCLMKGLPFAQVVPDTRALPAEALRFFYVDPNYQKALVDGALSVGLESGHEVLYQKLNYDLLADATAQEMFQVRAKLMGQAQPPFSKSPTTPAPAPAPDPKTPMAGFVMRSSLVAGWPGLEVRGFRASTLDAGQTEPTPSAPMKPVRMDRLAPDVMLVVFPDVPAWVTLGEPHEQLAFGHEDNGRIDLRWVSEGQAAPIGHVIAHSFVDVRGHFRAPTASAPTVNVTALSGAVSQGLTAAYGGTLPTGFDAADFAIQMVRAPEQMFFQNQPATQKTAAKNTAAKNLRTDP